MSDDMCPDTCVGYTGPYTELDACPECGELQYEPTVLAASNGEVKIPRRQFKTIPLGPQIQAIWRNSKGAEAMKHRQCQLDKIFETLAVPGAKIREWDDIYSGEAFYKAAQQGKIQPDDFVLVLSLDYFQCTSSHVNAPPSSLFWS